MYIAWLLFFFQYGALGIYYTFLNIYYSRAGISGTEIGFIVMSASLVGVMSSVGWGYLSDRTGRTRLCMAVGAIGALLLVQFTPLMHGMGQFLLLSSLTSVLSSAPLTLVDSATLSLLGSRREEYGRYRLGGSIGYILTASISGFLFERTGLWLMFPAYGLFMVGYALAAVFLPPIARKVTTAAHGQISKMIRQPAWILFTVCAFLIWIASSATMNFLSVALNGMKASQGLIGLVIAIPAVVEMPFMFYSGRLLRRYGPVKLLIISMFLMMLRYSLFAIMPNPAWALGINTIYGPGFVLFWNSAVNYANRLAPPGMTATAQGLFASTTSLAGVVSSVLAGWIYDTLGGPGLFAFLAACCLAALLLFSIGSRAKPVGSPQRT